MSKRHCGWQPLRAALAVLLASVSSVAADTVIRVDWDQVRFVGPPQVGAFETTHFWRTFTLSGKNELRVNSNINFSTKRVLLGAEGAQVCKGNANRWTYRVAGNTLEHALLCQ